MLAISVLVFILCPIHNQSTTSITARSMNNTDRKIRYEIFQFILDCCRPPTIQGLVDKTTFKEQDVVSAVVMSADLHHLNPY